ncbi:MAG: hypothetical protein IPM78_03335 [Moraxellaceae bacterium]|nr:hypothetical protein [Moraxellaceae bacterium]
MVKQKKVKPNTDWLIPSVDIKIKELTSKAWPRLPTSQLSAQLRPNSRHNFASDCITIDELLQVSVPMVSVVPYAAAFVVGPVVGGALVAAEAMLDNPITQMTTLHYDIKGSLAEPKVERIKNPIYYGVNGVKRSPLNQT